MAGRDDKPKRATKRRGRGEGSIFQRPDGTWSAEISLGTDVNGKRIRKTLYAASKKEVQAKLDEARAKHKHGTRAEPSKLTVGAMVEDWLETTVKPNRALNTYTRYRHAARLHIFGRPIAKLRIQEVRAHHIEQMLADMHAAGLGPRSRGHAHVVINGAFKLARKRGHVVLNPCAGVPAPRPEQREMQFWTQEEARRFLEHAARNRLYALYVLAITAGLRTAELCGLKWSDIDLDRGVLSLQRALVDIEGRVYEGPPKTKAGRRSVVLPKHAVDALRKHIQTMKAEGNTDSKYIFCAPRGGPILRGNLRTQNFRPLMQRAGVKMIRFQDLRHTSATLLLTAGVHPKIVAERLGHTKIGITLDIYSHVLPSMQHEAAGLLDSMLGPEPPKPDRPRPKKRKPRERL